MKKLMFAAVAALAMVGAANAAQSYGVKAENAVKLYGLDKSPSDAHGKWYSSYVMTQADAQKAMGTTETVTYQTMADWLGKNFDANKQSVIDNAEQIAFNTYGWQQYKFVKSGARDDSSSFGDAIGVYFYDDGENVAYNVMRNYWGYYFSFDDYVAGYSSGWTAATTGGVPEPTSGLLLLLGVAGLALKRKRQ